VRAVTDLDREAGLRALTFLVTVQAVAEGADAGREGRECQVMVVPLAKEGDKVCELAIVHYTRVIGCQDTVRDLPYLHKGREGRTEGRGRKMNKIMILYI
jgi:hypothetical protein